MMVCTRLVTALARPLYQKRLLQDGSNPRLRDGQCAISASWAENDDPYG